MRTPRLVLLLLLLAAVVARPASADVVTIPAIRDNTLFADADGDTSSGAGPAVFAGRNSQGRTRRALVAFDLAGSVPAGAQIDAVTLTLHVSSAGDAELRTVTVHRVMRAWGEGASSSSGGAGAPAMPGDATWLHAFYPATAWTTAGGDFASAPGGTQSVGESGPAAWSGPGLVADVAAWLADPAANHGWILRGDESVPSSVRRFDSREGTVPAQRPLLTIHFTRPDPVASLALSWGRLKSTYHRGAP